MAREPVATSRRDIMEMTPVGQGRLEGELMEAEASAGKIEYARAWGQGLSRGEQILWRGASSQAIAKFKFLAGEAGSYRLTLALSSGSDYGKAEISLNDKPVMAEQDLFAEKFAMIRKDAAIVDLRPGENIITVRMLGKNDKGKGMLFGIDYLEVKKP